MKKIIAELIEYFNALGFEIDTDGAVLLIADARYNDIAPEHIISAYESGFYSPCAVID